MTKPFSRDEFYARIYQNIETIGLFDRIQQEFDGVVINLLSEITEFKSAETSSHVKRISEYSYVLAKLTGMFDEEAQVVGKMATLHDIGKITVPDGIICKPSKLTQEEFEMVKKHTLNGHKLLSQAFESDMKVGQIAMDIALHHHEWWNGSGYPHGLSQTHIPIHARIVALVDVFDALVNTRVYKDAWELEDVLKYIEESAGTQFDPKLVELFLLNIECFLNILKKYGEDEYKPGYCKVYNR